MVDLLALKQAVGELEEGKVIGMLEDFIASNPSSDQAQEVLAACQKGMEAVGKYFEDGVYFIGDMMFAGELLTRAVELLKPVIGSGSSTKVGTIVLGTVAGDLHDIGKNIFKSIAEAAGFEIYDLGIDQSPEAFVAKIKQVNPQIVGMSGLLTLALDSMKITVDSIGANGLRDSVKIIIGGNPVNKDACEYIGADAFTTNAADGVKICQAWVGLK